MSAFTHGFDHGFAAGIFNRMLGGFNLFNFNCWNSAPMFFTPNYSFNNFFQYPSLTAPMPSVWSQNVPDFTNVENNWNLINSTGVQQNLTSFGGNFNQTNWQTSGFNFNANFPTMNFSNIGWGDCFTRTSGTTQSSSYQTGVSAKNWSKMTDTEMKKVYGNYTKNITELYKGSAEQLNKHLKNRGVLAGKGQAFINAQKKYGISASVLAAICIQETGGKSSNATSKNNVSNIAQGKGWRKFNSVEECIDYTAELLKNSYVNKGLSRLYQVNAKYCPVGDTRGSYTSQSAWAGKIQQITSKLEQA